MTAPLPARHRTLWPFITASCLFVTCCVVALLCTSSVVFAKAATSHSVQTAGLGMLIHALERADPSTQCRIPQARSRCPSREEILRPLILLSPPIQRLPR